MSLICKLCEVETTFLSERDLKKHARKVHDASVFLALEGNKVTPVKFPVDAPARIRKVTISEATERAMVNFDGAWVYKEEVPENYHSYIDSMLESRGSENTKEKEITAHAEACIARNNATLGSHARPEKKEPVLSVKLSLDDNDAPMVATCDTTKVDDSVTLHTLAGDDNSKVRKLASKPKETINLSYSQITSFLQCEQSWLYQYPQALAPRVENPKLQKGTLVHKAFEVAWYAVDGIKDRKEALKAARKSMKKAIEAMLYAYIDDTRALMQEELDAAIATAQEALNVAKLAFRALYKRFEPVKVDDALLVEYSFKFPIKKGVLYHGQIDLIAKDRKNGQVWLIDYKTRSAFQPIENQEFNLQMASYQYAMKELGIKTVGSLVWEVWHEAPKEPELLKNKKGLSQALIKTTWEVYAKAIEAHGFNEEDYSDMKEKLSSIEFFREARAYRNELEVTNSWTEIILPAVARAIDAYKKIGKGTFAALRTVSSLNTACPSCKFKEICFEELRGRAENAEDLKKENFVRNAYLDKYKA